MKSRIINIKGAEVTIATRHEQDCISLTDMVKYFGDESILYNWLRNRNTTEFLGIRERLYNVNFTQQSVNWATRTHYFNGQDSSRRVGKAHAVDMAVERQIPRGLRPPYETCRTCFRMSNSGYKKNERVFVALITDCCVNLSNSTGLETRQA